MGSIYLNLNFSKVIFRLVVALMISSFVSCSSGKTNNEIQFVNSRIHGFNLVAPRQVFSLDSLQKLKKSGAEWVAIVPYAFCNSTTGEIVFDHERQWWGEKPKGVSETIKMAHSLHLKVMIKPHLWVGGQGWAGDLEYESDSLWNVFEVNYEKYLTVYAKIADSLNVEMLCIGTEMRQSTRIRGAFWPDLIKHIKHNYGGRLTYAANWDEYNEIKFWGDLDYIGIDAYFPLSSDKNPNKSDLVKAWKKPLEEMEKVSYQFQKPIIFTEYGYESIDYNTTGHWNVSKDTLSVNFRAQKLAFEAVYEAIANENWWAGGFIWKWHLTQNGRQQRTIKAYTPQNKPAYDVIKKEFQR
jgi:hypothetical protein